MPTTANGYAVEFFGPLSARAQAWVIEALEACSFDPYRLDAGTANSDGGTSPHFLAVRGAAPEEIPHFGLDFVTQGYVGSGRYEIGIWSGLDAAPPPYGGRRFFKETVLHALGHLVGETLAYAADPYKRYECAQALMPDLPGAWGTARAWATFEQAPPSWRMDVRERFAETFKDVFGHPSARRFLNRTGISSGAGAVYHESHDFLPINGMDFLPHTGIFDFNGYLMRSVSVPFGSIVGNCSGNSRLCFDPCTLAEIDCFPCGHADGTANYQTGPFCGDSYGYPLGPGCVLGGAGWHNTTWGVGGGVPRVPFTMRDGAVLMVSGIDATDGNGPKFFACGMQPGLAGPGVPGSTQVSGTKMGRSLYLGDGLVAQRPELGEVNIARQVELILPLKLAPEGSTRFIYMADGYVDGLRAPILNAMTEYAPESHQANNFYIMGACRLLAPSAGQFVNPYGALNLEALDQGARPALASTGREAAVDEIRYGTWTRDGGGARPPVTLEGL